MSSKLTSRSHAVSIHWSTEFLVLFIIITSLLFATTGLWLCFMKGEIIHGLLRISSGCGWALLTVGLRFIHGLRQASI